MAEKKGIMKKVTEYFEGDREPGEIAPVDDSHVKGPSAVRVLDDAGSDITPEQEPETQGEETYQVEIAGVVREVNRETYDAVMAERATAQASYQPEPEVEQLEEFDVTEFYSDPAAALTKVKEEAKDELKAELKREAATERGQREFLEAFYQENPSLRDEKLLVQLILAKNMKSIQHLDTTTGRGRLAELVEKEILRIANKPRGKPKGTNSTTSLEGGSTMPTSESSDAEATSAPLRRPPSIGDALLQRKLDRQKIGRGETQLS